MPGKEASGYQADTCNIWYIYTVIYMLGTIWSSCKWVIFLFKKHVVEIAIKPYESQFCFHVQIVIEHGGKYNLKWS